MRQARLHGLLRPHLVRLLSLSRLSLWSGVVLAAGFMREVFIARQYGVSKDLDLFVALYGMYLFFGPQLGNTMESTLISKWPAMQDAEHRRRTMGSIALQLSVVLAASFVVMSFLFRPGFAALFPQLSRGHLDMALWIFLGLTASSLMASLSGLIRGALNSLRHFVPGIVGGAAVSLCTIAAMITIGHFAGIYALVIGVLAGNAVLIGVYLLLLSKNGYGPMVQFGDWKGTRWFWSAAGVVLIGEVLFQAFVLFQRVVSARVGEGTITEFYYASSLLLVPLTLVVVPTLATLYPRLAAVMARDRMEGRRLVIRYMSLIGAFAAVAAVAIALVSRDYVQLIFVRGKFSLEDARQTSQLLQVLCACLPFMAVSRLITYASYSISDYFSPAVANVVSIIVLACLVWFEGDGLDATRLALCIVAATAAGVIYRAAVLALRLNGAMAASTDATAV